jgi:hypothetical protein
MLRCDFLKKYAKFALEHRAVPWAPKFAMGAGRIACVSNFYRA